MSRKIPHGPEKSVFECPEIPRFYAVFTLIRKQQCQIGKEFVFVEKAQRCFLGFAESNVLLSEIFGRKVRCQSLLKRGACFAMASACFDQHLTNSIVTGRNCRGTLPNGNAFGAKAFFGAIFIFLSALFPFGNVTDSKYL